MGGVGYYEISKIHNLKLGSLALEQTKLRGITITLDIIENRIDKLYEEEEEEEIGKKLGSDIRRILIILKTIKSRTNTAVQELNEFEKTIIQLESEIKLFIQEKSNNTEEINPYYNSVKEKLSDVKKAEQVLATVMNTNLRDKATKQHAFEKEVQISIIGFTILIILFSILISISVSRSITQALFNLREATMKFRKGNLNARAQVRTKDEIGDLAESFNNMAVDLKKEIEFRKKSEQERIQVEKMATVGTLAAGVAHELNNPMMGILNYIEYCKDNIPKKDKKHKILKRAEKEVQRCIGIVKNLLTFSRTPNEGEEGFKQKKINLIVKRVLKLLSYKLKEVKVTKRFQKNIIAQVQENKIQQVLFNLIGNAIDSVQDSKVKKISIEGINKGSSIEISITDSGRGISPKNMKKIFDPFFTTKEVGKGTGLGLSICNNIINQHNGKLKFKSTVGKGSTFTIILPKNQKSLKKNEDRV